MLGRELARFVSTLKPTRLPTNAGMSLVTITLRPSRLVSIRNNSLDDADEVSDPE